MTAPELIGRDPEIAAVELLLARIAGGGGSLLVLGDPGIGKSALAEMAGRRAADRGMRVLTCAGVAGEAHLSFAGLHQLLRPVLAGADGLPRGQRDALLTALGVADGEAPAMPLVGLATLELLATGAGRAPVLVVAEDVHWLDSSTCEVLAFVGRRLGADPIGLVGTAREAELADNPLAGAGLTELPLGGRPWRSGRCTVPGCSSYTACGCAAASRPATPARRCAPRGTLLTRSAPMPGPTAPAESCAPPASATTCTGSTRSWASRRAPGWPLS